MAFDGTEGGPIDLKQAAAWTAKYRNTGENKIYGHFFGREHLLRLLEQDGCMGIRMYHALDDQGVHQLVLVGATQDERDQTEGLILDRSRLCPPDCGLNSELVK